MISFTNHAGTLSESFSIGKKGFSILQGTADPTGISAPTGSLYLLRTTAGPRVFQIDGSGTWNALLSPDSILAGSGIQVSQSGGAVTVTKITTRYKLQFTNADLTSGQLSVTHNLNEDFPIVQVYNNAKKVCIPDDITSNTANSTVIDFSSFGIISGTWTATVISQ